MEGILALVGLSSLLGIIVGFKTPFPKLKKKSNNFADNILVEDNKNSKESNSNSDHRIRNLSSILKQDKRRDREKKKIFEDGEEDELKDKELREKRIENPRILIKNNINSLKREINSLKYERKILLDSLDDILVGKREEKIDQYEFDRLYSKYKTELEKKDERITELESALEFDEIIDQRNDLTSTLENKIAEINSRIDELKSRYGFFDETAEIQEEKYDDNNRYEKNTNEEKNVKFNENSSNIQNRDNKHLSNADEEKIIEIEKKIEDTLKRLDKYNQNESNDKDDIKQYNYIESNDKDDEDKKIKDYKSSNIISLSYDKNNKHSNIIPDSSNINNFSASPLSNIYGSESIRDNNIVKKIGSIDSVIDHKSDNDNNKKQSNNEIENLQNMQQQQTNSVNSYNENNNNSSPLGNLFYYKSRK